MKNVEPKRLLVKYSEAAKLLGMGERKVWQLCKDGQLKVVRIGRSVRIPISELEAFIAGL